MYGNIVNIVNLYRVMSILKLKIKVKLPQLLCIVVSEAQKCDFERFGGHVTRINTQTDTPLVWAPLCTSVKELCTPCL